MVDAPKLTPMQVASIRANTEAFLKQHGGSSVELMPMLPKRLLLMCQTIEELYKEVECGSSE